MLKLNIIDRSMSYLLFLTVFFIGFPGNLRAQETTEPPAETGNPSESDAATQSASIFSIEGGNRLMEEADRAIDAQEYELAIEKLQNARQVYNQLSNFYLQLYNSFSGLDNAVAESHRKNALDTSIERDNATYQLALVHRAQNQPELSIPLLIQIVTSQSPLSGLGKKAYEQLLEIGFTDAPITPPAQRDSTPPETPPETSPETAPESQPTPTNPPAMDGSQPPTPQVPPTIPDPSAP